MTIDNIGAYLSTIQRDALLDLLRPPSIKNLKVISTTKTNAILQWTQPPTDKNIQYFEIYFKLIGTSDWQSAGQSTATTFIVNGLSVDTGYQFTVSAYTGISGNLSNIANGKTKPDLPIFSNRTFINVGGANNSSVLALSDDTAVYLNDLEMNGSSEVILNQGESYTFASNQFDTVSFASDKSIYVAGKSGSTITWQPAYLAGYSFAFGTNRSDPQNLKIWAIENSNIELYNGSNLVDTLTLNANSAGSINWSLGSGDKVLKLSSSGLILAYQHARNYTDPRVVLPLAPKIIGVPSSQGKLFTSYSMVNASILRSDGIEDVLPVVDGGVTPVSGTGNLYSGAATFISADDGGLAGMSLADRDGSCVASFLPTAFMSSLGGIPYDTDYVAFMSDEPATIDLFAGNSIFNTITLPGVPGCYKTRLINLPANTVFKARDNKKFYYVWQEAATNDETSGILYPD